jgi:GNAT superfamily N-acetyltransferase
MVAPCYILSAYNHENLEGMMITIRPFRKSDAQQVGILIADTFGDYNLSYASPEDRQLLLGPFRHARSPDPEHQAAIANIIRAEIMLVAEDSDNADGETIVGILRGRPTRLQSLFVAGAYHRQGIGRRLVECFEQKCLRQGSTMIGLRASLYAIPFYTRLGYKKTTGVRSGPCFDGTGFKYQPMRKRFT